MTQQSVADFTPETFHLPFPAFLRFTCEWLDSWEWSRDADAIFQLARALKGHPTMKGLSAGDAYDRVLDVAEKHRISLDVLDSSFEYEDGEVAFFSAWERVRFPMGTDPVAAACGLAGDGLIKTEKRRPGRYERFLTVAALLQLQVGQQPILLPVHKLAEHIPCEANTVSSWIRWAREDGVLIKTREHVFQSAGEGRAAEYVFGLHRWPTALPEIAGLLGLAVRKADVAWVREQFATAEE